MSENNPGVDKEDALTQDNIKIGIVNRKKYFRFIKNSILLCL